MKLKIWLKAFRLPFLTATIIPVALGATIAWHRYGGFHWFSFFLTLIGVSFLHIGTNLANDYFDHRTNNDELNVTPTPFSGGSRLIQQGLIRPRQILSASLIFFLIGIVIGLYLNWKIKGNTILILGIIGVFCGFFYTAYPLRIGYRGVGELIVGLCFGPLVVLGSYYVQTGVFSLTSFLASIPVGILIALVLYINEFPDYLADKAVDKKTLVVILGKRKALTLYHILLLMVYLVVISLVFFRLLPIYCVIVILSIPLALKAFVVSRRNLDKVYELLPANVSTIGLHLLIGLLLISGFMLDRVIKFGI